MNNNIQLNSNIEALKSLFEQEHDVELVILFGSLVTDNYSKDSDLDIAVKQRKPLSATLCPG